MKTKKFGTFILILTLLMEMLGSFGVAAKAYTVNEEVYNEAGNALLNFGLIQEYSDDKIETNKITRLDYVNIIVKVFETLKSNEEYTENSFSDVADNSEAAKTLAFAKKISLISGDTNGTFRPKDYITPNEAMAISLNALGYSVINGQAIGFNKYIDKARELKLSKNADTSKGYLNSVAENKKDAAKFVQLVKRYTEINELTYENVHEFIDRIFIHELDKETNTRQIDIFYNFVGKIDSNEKPCESVSYFRQIGADITSVAM
mgnify:CR=1 FL=1